MRKNNIFLVYILFVFSPICWGLESLDANNPGNFKNPQAVKEVLSGQRKTANAAWWGFDVNDATQAIQGAINSGAQKVIVPYMGSDWIVRPLRLESNQHIVFEPGVVVLAKKGEFKGKGDCLLSAKGKHDVVITGYGAILQMRKDDYKSEAYQDSQWRTGMSLLSCENIALYGLTIKNTGGDGLYIGESESQKPCRNIKIEDCNFDNNYRQGASVTSVESLRINNCIFRNTSGHSPGAGIDFEPNRKQNKLSDIVVSNCISRENDGAGFVVSVWNLQADSDDISILFDRCSVTKCKWGLFVANYSDQTPGGLIEFRDCTVNDTREYGVWVYVKSRMFDTNFINCTIVNSTIVLQPAEQIPKEKIGIIRMENCYAYYNLSQPVIYLRPYNGSTEHENIRGTLYVKSSSEQVSMGLEDVNSFSIISLP